MDEAVAILKQLKANTEKEEWAVPAMKRAVLTGVTLSIKTLESYAKGEHETAQR